MDQIPLPVLLRHFRRQFLLLRAIYPSGTLSLTIDSSSANVSDKFSLPPGALEYATVLRPFADRTSPLYVPDFWSRVRVEPSLDPTSVTAIDQQLARARAGTAMLIKVNTRRMDAEAIYHLVADGELFGEDERAAKTLNAFRLGPTRQLLRFTAHNYMADLGALLPLIYDALRPLLALHPSKVLPISRCIYCLRTDATFTSEDHPLPESLAGETIVLPRGAVCDACNNGLLAQLDKSLVDCPPISLLRVLFLPHTKQGKYPKARFPNFRLEKTGPRAIRIRVFGKSPMTTAADGMISMTWKGKALDLRALARAFMRTGLGVLAYDYGCERAYHSDFDAARAFIRQERPLFAGRLFLDTSPKPEPSIYLFVRDTADTALFAGTLFGLNFAVSLREGATPELPAPAPPSLVILDLSSPG